MPTIVAIGGYTSKDGNTSMESLTIDREIVRLTGKKHPRALFLGTATQDHPKYIAWFEKMYGKTLHCTTDTLCLYTETYTHKQLVDKILTADLIYVGGGNTLRMMLRWKRFGVTTLLKQAYKKGIVLAGVSAGSICWFEYGVSDSRQFKNPRSTEFIRVSGLGLLKGLHCPHYKSPLEDRGFRSKGLKLISRRTPGLAIAIEDGCAVAFIDGATHVISFGKGAKAWRVGWVKGRYGVKEIL